MDVKKLIKEELTKTYVKGKIDDAISSKKLEDIIKKVVSDQIEKKYSELEKQTEEIVKNIILQFHKTIWVKRGMWKNALKNKAS